MAKTSRRRSIVQGEEFQRSLRSNYRFWARLGGVTSVWFSGLDGRGKEIVLAVIHRPPFPKGICNECGCSHFDPCITPGGDCCAWTDATETGCTFCAPARSRRPRR